MPLYEFQCRSCHETFEELVRSHVDANEPVVCPACGAKDAVRQLSATARTGATEGGGHGGGCSGHGGFS